MSAEIALDLAPQTPLRVRAIAAFCRLLVGGYTRRIVEGAEQLGAQAVGGGDGLLQAGMAPFGGGFENRVAEEIALLRVQQRVEGLSVRTRGTAGKVDRG